MAETWVDIITPDWEDDSDAGFHSCHKCKHGALNPGKKQCACCLVDAGIGKYTIDDVRPWLASPNETNPCIHHTSRTTNPEDEEKIKEIERWREENSQGE